MRWFKHYSDNYRGRSIEELYAQLGHTGISCYYLLTEICAEKLEKNPSETLTSAACKFSFSVGFARRNLRVSSGKLQDFLRVASGLGLFQFDISEKELQIYYPILLELLDSHSKKSVSRRESDRKQSVPDKIKNRIDREIDVEYISSSVVVSSPLPNKKIDTEQNRKIWIAYADAYRLRYGIEPLRNATVNTQVAALRKKLGAEDAVQIVKFYLEHNDSFYLRQTHTFGLCLKDAETLRTQWLKGKSITSTMVRSYEKNLSEQEKNQQLENLYKD